MSNFAYFTTPEFWALVAAYFPLGVVGVWRWGVWLIKKSYAATYRPATGTFTGTVSVITPVYNEDPVFFRRALESWRDNGVEEIIAVIDYTDTRCIATFKEFAREFSGAKLIVTKKPGKRPALAEGMRAATSTFAALVDSDTLWEPTVKERALIPFQDPKVGGVSTRQQVWQPRTLAQRIFNAQLQLRYLEELPFMTAVGGTVITCISGRTGFYRRAAVLPLLQELEHETFWGKPVISGDDKRLTYLVEKAGWKVAFQQNALVFTPGMPQMRNFLKQRLRWTRNSWRADLRTLTQPWVYRHPRFVWYLLDRTVQPFATLLSPVFFIVSLLLGLWIPAAILLAWWHLGRTIRLAAHLRRRPQDLILVPAFVFLNFYFNVMKVYALVTMNRQGWITRWDKNRLPAAPQLIRIVGAYVMTAVIVGSLATGVTWHEVRVFNAATAAGSVRELLIPLPPEVSPSLPKVTESVPPFTRYVVQPRDTVYQLAQRFDITPATLISYNATVLPSATAIQPGLVLTVPAPGTPPRDTTYESSYEEIGPLRITYVAATNTIEVRGRGQQVTLADIRRAVPAEQLEEVEPKQWYLAAHLVLKAGVHLALAREEVEWLKLKSDPTGSVFLTAESGQISISGTKVTSWERERGTVDEVSDDGRSYVAVYGDARLDIFDAELAYLGMAPVDDGPSATYGVAWKAGETPFPDSLVTGEVRGSAFHHNYHGAYASGATGMQWADNRFTDNHRYGLDFFGGTTMSLVERVEASRNGAHGIILSHDCSRNTIREAMVAHNGQHGLILHEQSNHNVIAKLTAREQQDGLVLHRSADNVIEHATLESNRRGARLAQGSHHNTLRDSRVSGNERYGLYLDKTAEHNAVLSTTIERETTGLYLQGSYNQLQNNQLTNNEIGVYLAPFAHDTVLRGNTFSRHTHYGVYLKTQLPQRNFETQTIWQRNRRDIGVGSSS